MRISKHLLAAAALLAFAVSPAMAYEKGDWILRAGVGTVAPDSDNLVLPDFPADGINTTVEVDDGTSLTLMGTYMFTDNWAFDILAAWPFSHDINIKVVDTLPPGSTTGLKIAETEHLPPTFSIQYHFLPDSAFQPYVGAGVNWTTFLSTDVTQEFTDLLGVTSLDLDDSFGLALQLGADWVFGNNWLVNVDFRWINIETDATISDGTTSTEIGTVAIDPYVYSINIGYRF
jgi:outer membrane protein